MNTVTYERSGPLSMALLQDAYYVLVWGYTEPDTIKCSRATKAKLITDLFLDAHLDNDRLIRFCNATLEYDDTLDDHTIIICYTEPPEYFRQHKCAYQVRVTLTEPG